MTQFFEPLAVDELLRDAWDGATAALLCAGVSEVPSPPDFPVDPEAAYAMHDQAFPTLERFANGQLSHQDLAAAALDELLTRRRDVHTVFSFREADSGRSKTTRPAQRVGPAVASE